MNDEDVEKIANRVAQILFDTQIAPPAGSFSALSDLKSENAVFKSIMEAADKLIGELKARIKRLEEAIEIAEQCLNRLSNASPPNILAGHALLKLEALSDGKEG